MEKNLIKSEYEIQHFKFSAASLTYQRKQLMREMLLTLLNKAACKMSDNEQQLQALKCESEAIANQFFEDIQPELDLLKKMDEANFSIPPHVLLPTDFGHAKENCTAETNAELDKKLEELEKKFLDTTLMSTCLKMENSDYDAIEALVKEEENVQDLLLSAKPLEEVQQIMNLYQKFKNKN